MQNVPVKIAFRRDPRDHVGLFIVLYVALYAGISEYGALLDKFHLLSENVTPADNQQEISLYFMEFFKKTPEKALKEATERIDSILNELNEIGVLLGKSSGELRARYYDLLHQRHDQISEFILKQCHGSMSIPVWLSFIRGQLWVMSREKEQSDRSSETTRDAPPSADN